MSKIYFDYEDRKCNNNLREALENLFNVTGNYISVPYGFSKSREFNQIKNNLNTIYNSLKGLEKWLEDSQKKYSDFVDEMTIAASKLGHIEIKSASSIVK